MVTESALAFVLLIFTGLMINTLTRILQTSPGFVSEHLLTAQVRLTGDQYINAYPTDPDHNLILRPVGQFCDRVLDRFRTTPGVEDVALIDWLPLLDGTRGTALNTLRPALRITSHSCFDRCRKASRLKGGISADYFAMMRIPTSSSR